MRFLDGCPTFAWQEAIVNAVAHRDYSLQGAPIEVWMYDDRMEIRSPGLPPAPVTIETLNRREPLHLSRNPLLVRVLTDLQYMRDMGEGIPRMFDEMDRAGCYPPRFELIGGFVFQLTLRNEPVYDRDTLLWLRQFEGKELTGDQKRILAYAHAHGGRFTSRNYQDVIRTDIYRASAAIKDMIRKGVAQSMGKGSRVYLVREPSEAAPMVPPELASLFSLIQSRGGITNGDVRNTLGKTRATATRLLGEWVQAGWLIKPEKRGVGAVYEPGPGLLHQPQNAPEGRETDAMPPETDATQP